MQSTSPPVDDPPPEDPKLRISLLSDIHLEHRNLKLPKLRHFLAPEAVQSCDVLCLAGDIGDPNSPAYQAFLQDCSNLVPYTIVISGNHEYYNTKGIPMAYVDKKIHSICTSLSNVYYLNNSVVNICHVSFIGSVLWSNIPEQHAEYVSRYLNDYNYIYAQPGRRLQVCDVNAMHKRSLRFIDNALDYCNNHRKTTPVVVTHHVPLMTGTSDKHYEGKPGNCGFATDLSSFMAGRSIAAWICGHTYHNFRLEVGGVQVMANQFGYHETRPEHNFVRNFMFAV